MKKYLFLLTIAILILFSLNGCFIFDVLFKSNKFLLKADISDIVLQKSKAELHGEYYFVYVNLKDDFPQINYKKLKDSNLEIELQKDGIYVMGIAKKTTDMGIQMIGIFSSPELGLNTLPVNKDANDEIDLGKIIEDLENDNLNIGIDSNSLSNLVGYDEDLLRSFGKYDITLKNFLNPDINRNGVFDIDEKLIWKFTTMFYYNFNDFNYDFENNPIPSKSVKDAFDCFSFVLWINWEGHDFVLDTDVSQLISPDGKIYNNNGSGFEPGNFYQYYFNIPLFDNPPKSGNYKINIKDKNTDKTYTLYFNNLDFFKPSENFKGLILPLFQSIVFSDGKLNKLIVDWFKVNDYGIFENVDPEEVKLVSRFDYGDFYFYFYPELIQTNEYEHSFNLLVPKQYFNNPEEGFSYISKEEDNFWLPRQYNYNDFNSLRAAYWDIGRDDVSSYFYHKFLKYPHDYEKGLSIKPDSPDKYNGVWVNYYYNFENYKKIQNGQYPDIQDGDIPGFMVFNKENNQVSAYWIWNDYYQDNPNPVFVGTYEVYQSDYSKVKIVTDNTSIYLYVKFHNTYMEYNYSFDNYPDKIDPDSDNYRIYSYLDYEIKTVYANSNDDNSNNTSENSAPAIPSSPNPENEAINIRLYNFTLSWDCSDPDGDSLTYYVYLSNDDNNYQEYGPFYENKFYIDSNHKLNPNTTYYWIVLAVDSNGTSINGPKWSFTTGPGE